MSEEGERPEGSVATCAWCGELLAAGIPRCGKCGVVVPQGEYERGVLSLAGRNGPERLTAIELRVAVSLNLPIVRHFVQKGVVGSSGYSGHVWLPKRLAGRSFTLIIFDSEPEPDEQVPKYYPDE